MNDVNVFSGKIFSKQKRHGTAMAPQSRGVRRHGTAMAPQSRGVRRLQFFVLLLDSARPRFISDFFLVMCLNFSCLCLCS